MLVPSDTENMAIRNDELKVAALQNTLYIATANAPGDNKGKSAIFSPYGWQEDTLMAEAGADEMGIIYADLDISKQRKWREEEDIGKYRNKAAYRL